MKTNLHVMIAVVQTNASDPRNIRAWDDIAGIYATKPFLIQKGAKLNGTITEKNISLTVAGQTQYTLRRFNCAIGLPSI